MTFRARIAIVIASLLLMLGVGAGMQAANAETVQPTTANNGCIVVPSLQIATCLNRF